MNDMEGMMNVIIAMLKKYYDFISDVLQQFFSGLIPTKKEEDEEVAE